MTKKGSLLFLCTFLVGMMLVQSVSGKEFPTRPIEFVIAFSPGSSTDLMTRTVATTAKKYLGQPLLIVAKPGAGGSIAAADVISSKPDGYKILSTTHTFFFTTVLTQKIPFDPNDLVPLVNIAEYKDGLVVKGDSPWKTFNDLLDYGRKNPGKLRWGHTGRGHSTHVCGFVMFKKAGVETVDIPYKGAPEKIAALLGGHVQAITNPYGSIRDLAESGKVRYLLFHSERRYKYPSDVPSAAELGFPEPGKLNIWMSFFVRKDTPENIKKILVDAFKKTCEDPEFKEQFGNIGEELRFMEPEALKEAMQKSTEIVVPILKDLGIYVGK